MKNLKTLTALFIFLGFATFSYAQMEVTVAAAAKCVCDIPANHAKDSVYNHLGTDYVITYVGVTHTCDRSICLVDKCKYKLRLKNASGGTVVYLETDCKFATATAAVDEFGTIGNREVHPANNILAINRLSPNPVSAGQNLKFDVNLPEAGDFGIEVYDLAGRVVMSQAFQDRNEGIFETVLFTNKLTRGHYFVKLISRGQVAVQKFTVL